jgi:hypothetical protein
MRFVPILIAVTLAGCSARRPLGAPGPHTGPAGAGDMVANSNGGATDLAGPAGTVDLAGAGGDMGPMPTARMCGGDIEVNSAAQLQALAGCREVTGMLTIRYGKDITDLAPLAQLQRVDSALVIDQLDNLVSVHGLESLVSVGGTLEISGSTALHDVALPALVSVEGSLSIEDNLGLLHIGGLGSLQSIGGELRLNHDTNLTSFDDMPALKTLGGFTLFGCDSLARLSGFGGVHELGGDLTLSSPGIADFTAFPNMTRVHGTVNIAGSAQLTRVALPQLDTIDAQLNIVTVPLTSLDGLHVTKIGDALRVEQNPALTRVDALATLTSVGGALTIARNPMLPPCQATRVTQALTASGYKGMVDTSGNGGAGTCN